MAGVREEKGDGRFRFRGVFLIGATRFALDGLGSDVRLTVAPGLGASVSLSVGEFQLHISRPAMIALAGVRRDFHFAQQRVHLLRLQAAAGAHRAVAGHGGCDMHQPPLQRQRLVPFGHVLGEVAQQRLCVRSRRAARAFRARRPRRGRRLRWPGRSARARSARVDQPLDVGLVEFDDFRDQQHLPRDAIALERGFQPLIDDAAHGRRADPR